MNLVIHARFRIIKAYFIWVKRQVYIIIFRLYTFSSDYTNLYYSFSNSHKSSLVHVLAVHNKEYTSLYLYILYTYMIIYT